MPECSPHHTVHAAAAKQQQPHPLPFISQRHPPRTLVQALSYNAQSLSYKPGSPRECVTSPCYARSATMSLFAVAFSAPVPLSSAQKSMHGVSIASRCFPSPERLRCRKAVLSMNANEDQGEEPQFSVQSRDWREFRAALVAGSLADLERAKEDAYRKGHWAHSVSKPPLPNHNMALPFFPS